MAPLTNEFNKNISLPVLSFEVTDGTSGGQYPKCYNDGKYYKLGNITSAGFVGREVLNESVCSKLAKEIGINTVLYEITPVTAVVQGVSYRTISNVSDDVGRISTHAQYLTKIATPQETQEFLGKEFFTKMKFLDAITMQEDRHENNYGFNNGKQILFDYGRSLMFNYDDSLLLNYDNYDFAMDRRHWDGTSLREVMDLLDKNVLKELISGAYTSYEEVVTEERAQLSSYLDMGVSTGFTPKILEVLPELLSFAIRSIEKYVK